MEQMKKIDLGSLYGIIKHNIECNMTKGGSSPSSLTRLRHEAMFTKFKILHVLKSVENFINQ
jgi:hypothetical protein